MKSLSGFASLGPRLIGFVEHVGRGQERIKTFSRKKWGRLEACFAASCWARNSQADHRSAQQFTKWAHVCVCDVATRCDVRLQGLGTGCCCIGEDMSAGWKRAGHLWHSYLLFCWWLYYAHDTPYTHAEVAHPWAVVIWLAQSVLHYVAAKRSGKD